MSTARSAALLATKAEIALPEASATCRIASRWRTITVPTATASTSAVTSASTAVKATIAMPEATSERVPRHEPADLAVPA